MAKASGDDRLDGLEIVSIGSLYSGSWIKKYWSSSRGKDRYPYPVGYSAMRTQNGITYKMEILEGLKGPLFMISSTDGKSCSGQTPDIAWERFQKKSSSQVKLWHGKRFSFKIDGVEFFGFKNAFVQRLMRELVANVSEGADRCGTPSTFCNGAVESRHQIECAESNADLVQYLEKPRVTKKRSRKDKINNIRSIRVIGGREPVDSACASDNHCGSSDTAQDFTVPMNLENVVMNGGMPSSPVRSLDLDHLDILDDKVSDPRPQEPTKLSCFNHNRYVEEAGSLSNDNEPLDRSKDLNAQDCKIKVGLKKGEEIFISNNLLTDSHADISDCCISDLPPDTHFNSSANNVDDVIISNQMTVSDTLETESYPEDDTNSSVPHTSSEKGDFDLVRQDIAKSMMRVLLPRALPLLKTFSRKRKKNPKPSERSQLNKENTKTGPHLDALCSEEVVTPNLDNQREIIQFPRGHSVVPNVVHMDTVVPDSFDNDDIEYHLSNQLMIGPDYTEPALSCLSRGHSTEKTSIVAVRASAEARTPACNDRADDFVIAQHFENNMALHQGGQGDSSKWQSSLGDNSSCKGTYLESSLKTVGNGIHFGQEDCKTLLDSTEDVRTDAYAAEPENTIGIPPQESTENAQTFSMSGNQSAEIAAETSTVFPLAKSTPCTGPKDTLGSEVNAKLQTSKFSELNSSQVQMGVCLPSDAAPEAPKEKDLVNDDLVSCLNNQNARNMSGSEKVKQGLHLKAQTYSKQDITLVGGYVHPMPVEMVLLSREQDEVYICVLCGISEHEEKIIFLYTAQMKGQNMGSPYFYGHSSIIVPSFQDVFGRDIATKRSGLQFTSDARSLVLMNSIRTPYCSDGFINCSCGSCKVDSCKKNAVKIVQVKGGFVSIVTKLKTTGSVCCILVCEPNYLVAAEDSGNLYLWVLNSSWSAVTAEYHLPTPGSKPPCPVELEKIPKAPALILGHNGFGDFCLWDIVKCILVNKFSTPNTPVQQFIPVSFFRWQMKGTVFADSNMEELVSEILNATKSWLSETNERQFDFSDDAGDVAIWLLISAGAELEYGHRSMLDAGLNKSWRLALLVKNKMLVGSALDPRAAAVGASAGHGIIGRSDGLVYMGELSTGLHSGSLHHFKGGSVSCVATDDSGSGSFAIASNGGELLVYKRS